RTAAGGEPAVVAAGGSRVVLAAEMVGLTVVAVVDMVAATVGVSSVGGGERKPRKGQKSDQNQIKTGSVSKPGKV
nr:hypothetical protein [Tanacetum cinerariifolium]